MTETEWQNCISPDSMLTFLEGRISDRKLRLFGVACCRRIAHLVPDSEALQILELTENEADSRRVGSRTPSCVAIEVHQRLSTISQYPDATEALLCLAGMPGYSITGWFPSGYHLWPRYYGQEASLRVPSLIRAAAEFCGWACAVHADAAGLEHSIDQVWELPEVQNADERTVRRTALTLAGHIPWANASRAEQREQAALLREIAGNPFDALAIDESWLVWNEATISRMARAIYEERAFECLPVLADALEDAGCTDPDILAHCRVPATHVRGCWLLDLLQTRT